MANRACPNSRPSQSHVPRVRVLAAATLSGAVAVAGILSAGCFSSTAAQAAGTGPTGTCTPVALSAARTRATAALTRRVAKLHELSAAVAASTGLTSSDRSTLTTDITNDLAGLSALQQKVPTDTSCVAVAAVEHAMVVEFRVFVVMSPQVHLTIAADTETALAGALEGLEPKIAARITAAKQNGVTVRAAENRFSDLESQVGTATTSSAGVAASVLALTPASYPGSSQTLENASTKLAAGHLALLRARADLRSLKAAAR